MRISYSGELGSGVTPKDLILATIGRLGTGGMTGYAVEYAGPAIEALSMPGRMTICNMTIEVAGRVPDPAELDSPADREAAERALAYMGLEAGTPMTEVAPDRVFIGSCTNSRIEDLREAAAIVDGRKVATSVHAMVVPGSQQVKKAAEAEG